MPAAAVAPLAAVLVIKLDMLEQAPLDFRIMQVVEMAQLEKDFQEKETRVVVAAALNVNFPPTQTELAEQEVLVWY